MRTVKVNYANSILVAHAVWKNMTQDTELSRRYCVISSSSGHTPRADEVVYASTKFAQFGFTASLGEGNDTPNITVTLVTPGGMKTTLWSGQEPPDYADFMDSAKVAEKIVESVSNQVQPYNWLRIPRGSL